MTDETAHQHEWRDTGFATVDDCECGATKSGDLVTEPDNHVYMGMQIIVDITGKNQEEIWTAIEKVLCGACDTGERDCTIESMASCTLTGDLQGVFAWMNSEEPNVQQAQAEGTPDPTE